jgi:recombinational DNA repair ATPase RecF
MQVGDLAKIVLPSFIGDSQLIIDAWHGGKPVLILDESTVDLHDGAKQELALIQFGERQTWILKSDLEPYK